MALKTTAGFIVLCLSIYLLIASFLSVLVFGLSSSLLLQVRTQAVQTSLAVACLTTQSLLASISATMPLEAEGWINKTPPLVWRTHEHYAGFIQKGTHLWWVTGRYKVASKAWTDFSKKILLAKEALSVAWDFSDPTCISYTASLHYQSLSLAWSAHCLPNKQYLRFKL